MLAYYGSLYFLPHLAWKEFYPPPTVGYSSVLTQFASLQIMEAYTLLHCWLGKNSILPQQDTFLYGNIVFFIINHVVVNLYGIQSCIHVFCIVCGVA